MHKPLVSITALTIYFTVNFTFAMVGCVISGGNSQQQPFLGDASLQRVQSMRKVFELIEEIMYYASS